MGKKSEEFVIYVAQQVVKYMETPKEVRRQARAERKETREHWKVRWFGMLPLAMRMWTEQWARRKGKDR